MESLLEAIEASDGKKASELLAKNIDQGVDPWEIHLSLFPVVQRVLNPPFINPHLPKMYAVSRELIPYLSKNKVSAFLNLEVREYAKRPKMEKIRRPADPRVSPVTFKEIETAIREDDPERTARFMAAFLNQKGGQEFARRLLLLGSGYLNNSLGHSVSCTAFILLEMLDRTDADPWPALAALASYFCKGKFHTTPALNTTAIAAEQPSDRHLFRSISGRGIVNLHHTITRYALERARRFLGQDDYVHMVNAWIDFLGNKKEEGVSLQGIEAEQTDDYDRFYRIFSTGKTKPVVASSKEMLGSEEGRGKIKRFLVQGVCDRYQGAYDPHFLTGLGSVLWMLDQHGQNRPLAVGALLQYLDFFFSGLS